MTKLVVLPAALHFVSLAPTPTLASRSGGRAWFCWHLRRSFVVGLALQLFSLPSWSWESDVHYGLTKWLAEKAGFKATYASQIANTDEDLDRTGMSAVDLVFTYACSRHDRRMSIEVRDHHFPSDADVPNPPAARAVMKGGPSAHLQVDDEIHRRVSATSTDAVRESLRRFGEGLHSLQDSWSHQGVPDVPGFLLSIPCDEELAWGHPADRGGWIEYFADYTWRWPEDTKQTAKATYEALQAYLQAHPWARQGDEAPWETIAPEIEIFMSAKTRNAKRDWFRRNGFSDISFLSETTLPTDADDVADELFYSMAAPTRELPKFLRSQDIPLEVVEGYSKFFQAWLFPKKRDIAFSKFFATQEMASTMGLYGYRMLENKQTAVLASLSLWRLKDFGKALQLMSEQRRIGVIDRKSVYYAMQQKGALVSYKSIAGALQPLGKGAPPFVVVPLKVKGGEISAHHGDYVALARLRHAANTVVLVRGARGSTGFRVTGFQSLPTH